MAEDDLSGASASEESIAVVLPAIEDLKRLWREGIESGPPEPLDMEDIKRDARTRFVAEGSVG